MHSIILHAEVQLLEENLGSDKLPGNLMLGNKYSFEYDIDMSIYDKALNEEEKMEHKEFVDLARDCAKKSPDPQTKVS